MISASAPISSPPDNTMFQRMDNPTVPVKPQNASSSRILDIPCRVCGDYSSGKHYNIFACDGCAGFFKRSIRRDRKYSCKAKEAGTCTIDKIHRNQCRACRLKKCEEAGMNKDVQHERGPRNSTLKKQQISYLSEANARLMLSPSQSNVLNLTIGRTPSPKSPPRMIDNVLHLFPPPSFFYNSPPFSRFSSSHPPYPPSPPIFNQFQLAPTTEDTTLPVICESAARLLFMNVQWAVTVPEYMALPVEDQVNLMELAWRDLFVVSIAQLLPLLDLTGPYFSRRITTPTIQRGAEEFKEIVEKIKSMMLDTNEYQTLRHVLLFRASTNLYDKSNIFDLKNLIQKNRVLQLQDEYLTNLNNYIASVHMDQPLRFTKLMLILPHLKTVTNYIIEELFFRKTIGSISLNKIMCDMYRNHLEKIRPI